MQQQGKDDVDELFEGLRAEKASGSIVYPHMADKYECRTHEVMEEVEGFTQTIDRNISKPEAWTQAGSKKTMASQRGSQLSRSKSGRWDL